MWATLQAQKNKKRECHFNTLDFTANMHSALKILLDNVDIGIKGVLVRHHQLSIHCTLSNHLPLSTTPMTKKSYKVSTPRNGLSNLSKKTN